MKRAWRNCVSAWWNYGREWRNWVVEWRNCGREWRNCVREWWNCGREWRSERAGTASENGGTVSERVAELCQRAAEPCHREWRKCVTERGGTVVKLSGPTILNAGARVQRGLAHTRHHGQCGVLRAPRNTQKRWSQNQKELESIRSQVMRRAHLGPDAGRWACRWACRRAWRIGCDRWTAWAPCAQVGPSARLGIITTRDLRGHKVDLRRRIFGLVVLNDAAQGLYEVVLGT